MKHPITSPEDFLIRSIPRRPGTTATFGFIAAAALGACGPEELTDPSLSRQAIFLVQSSPATVVMEALYEGQVTRDAQGCLRLAVEDRHTVIWPFGFSLDQQGGALIVKDAAGHPIGEVGGAFRFGGGEVPFLHDSLDLSQETRQRAEANCPGRYWIVGDTSQD